MNDLGDETPDRRAGKKIDIEAVQLRAQPRAVARFKRHVVIGIAAGGCVFVLVAMMVALRPSSIRDNQTGSELLGVDRKQIADQLAGLPKSYGDLAPKPPKLGPPLPGDLGPPILHAEQSVGIAPSAGSSLRPDAEADSERAERMRVARQLQQANESKIFFQTAVKPPQVGGTSQAVAPAHSGEEGAGLSPAKLDLDPERDPNNQQHKLELINGKQDERAVNNPHGLQRPVSPYQVMAGTVISASLITGLNSDLPGQAIAQVTENIYDSVTGSILLIPQGSRLIGSYDSVVAFGQSRALLVWQRIVMPDGTSVVIDNLPATDKAGYAGLEDEVDFHTWQLLKGVVLSTLLGTGSQVTFGNSQSNLVQAIRQSTQESVNQAGQRLVEKTMNIQPTITVRPGWPLRVIVHKDLVLQPYRG